MYSSRPGFKHLADLPFDEGETIAAMTIWEALGKSCVVLVTSEGRMFVLRFDPSGRQDIAGPLEWAPHKEADQ